MKGIRHIAFAIALCTMAVGANQCSIPVVDNVRLDVTTEVVKLTSDFDRSVMIDVGGRFLIPDLDGAFIEITPGGGGKGSRPASISFGLDISNYSRDFNLVPVDSLPNGIPFPGTVTGPLLGWTIKNQPTQTMVAYIGIETGEIGFAAQLGAFDKVLPPGWLITIVYRDEETDEVVADVTLYGPAADQNGKIVRSGGAFVHAYIPTDFLPGGALEGEAFYLDTADTYEERM